MKTTSIQRKIAVQSTPQVAASAPGGAPSTHVQKTDSQIANESAAQTHYMPTRYTNTRMSLDANKAKYLAMMQGVGSEIHPANFGQMLPPSVNLDKRHTIKKD